MLISIIGIRTRWINLKSKIIFAKFKSYKSYLLVPIDDGNKNICKIKS